MKTRIKLVILMLLFAGSSAIAQKEKTQFSIKAYLPVNFNAENYKIGYYTWGRWYVPGIELGLNLKKKRFEQEFILGSPRAQTTTSFYHRQRDSVTSYYVINDMIQTSIALSYQVGYSVYTGKSGKFSIVPGLGMALHAGLTKMVRYDDAPGVIETKMQTVAFSPYLFSTFRYAISEKWGVEASFMYRPYYLLYWRSKHFYGSGNEVDHYWGSGDYGSWIYSRFGVSYKF